MYQRIVCFKFVDGASETAIQQHMEGLKKLKDAIPQIITYSGGMIVENDEMPSEYDSMHYLTFESLEAIDIYFHHEAHQAFIAQNGLPPRVFQPGF